MPDEARLRRLSYRAWRRGFREADLILGPFVDAHAASLGPEELDALERLLDQPDHDLFGWIVEREPVPATFDGEVMRRLKAFRHSAHAAPQGAGA